MALYLGSNNIKFRNEVDVPADSPVIHELVNGTIGGEYINSRVDIVGSYAFRDCDSLTTANFPSVTSIGGYAFVSCYSLTTANFPSVTSIGGYAFGSCYNLISLNLAGISSVPTLSSTAFNSTPIGGYSTSAGQYGSVYVPSSLYSSFQTATYWSDIATRIVSV